MKRKLRKPPTAMERTNEREHAPVSDEGGPGRPDAPGRGGGQKVLPVHGEHEVLRTEPVLGGHPAR